MVTLLKEKGYEVYVNESRLEDRNNLEKFILLYIY